MREREGVTWCEGGEGEGVTWYKGGCESVVEMLVCVVLVCYAPHAGKHDCATV